MKAAVGTLALAVALVACGPSKATNEPGSKGTAGVADSAKEAGKDAVDATKDAAKNAGEAMSDAWITATINTKFVGEDLLKNSDIDVDTSNKVVTLKGSVVSKAGRERAIEIAKTTDGVNSVVDELRIAPKAK